MLIMSSEAIKQRPPWADRPRGRGVSRIDWEAARRAYVQGFADGDTRVYPSMPEVAVRFACSLAALRAIAARDKWTAARESFHAEIRATAAAQAARDAVEYVRGLDNSVVRASVRGVELIHARYDQIEADLAEGAATKAEYDRLRAEGADAAALEATGWTQWLASAVDAREIQALASAVQTLHATAHKAVGDVDVSRVEVSGVGGGPIEVDHSVTAELQRDDPERLLKIMQAMLRAQYGRDDEPLSLGDGSEILEGDLVEDTG